MDLEDKEDLYDWYRFDNALARLDDEASCLAIKTMVHSLSQTARVGLVIGTQSMGRYLWRGICEYSRFRRSLK